MSDRSIFTGDSVVLESDIFTDQMGFEPANPSDVSWELADPNGNRLILDSLPTSTIAGDIVILSEDSDGFYAWDEVQFNGAQWTKIGQAYSTLQNYKAILTVPGDVTDVAGLYKALVHFTLDGPIRKSQLLTFEALEGLGNVIETTEDVAIDRAWMMLEDCFDSQLGGPWLRDMTLAFFNRDKMAKLIPNAFTRINYTYYPVTNYNETTWDWTNDGALFAQALLVETINHLIRSYTEQPLPTGSPITWMNRTDYANRWKLVLDMEEAKLKTWLDTWKVQFFGFGRGAYIIGGYASTALRAPRALRTRLPRYYAGLYRRW